MDKIKGLVKYIISSFLNHPIHQSFISGFQPKEKVFKSTFDDFDGNVLNIVMPNTSLIFTKVYTYPDKTLVRAGADYMAALYLGEALNFKVR